MVRWGFLIIFVAMIQELPKYDDLRTYLDEPLLEYATIVANNFWLFYDPEIQEPTYSHVPDIFHRRYSNGKINTERLKKYVDSTEVQDTLRAFGIDREKFWYLCLLIKDYVEDKTINAVVDNPTHREEMINFALEIEKLKPKRWADLYLTEGEGQLTVKIGKHPVIIKNGHTLTLIKIAVEEYLKRNQDNTLLLDSAPVDFDNKITLADGYKIYLFDKFLSWFLQRFKANKNTHSSDGNIFVVSTDKKLLISRMLFVLGISDDEAYYEEFKDNSATKNDKLKNTLKNYRNVEIPTSSNIYAM